MNTIAYLKQIYGYDEPIFIKNIRIGKKTKSSIKQDLYRAVLNGEISRESSGVYYFKSNKKYGSGISFEQIIERKYIKEQNYGNELDDLFIIGFYTGFKLVNDLGLSQQVPSDFEIVTNNTKSYKYIYNSGLKRAIIRKAPVEITFGNWRILQFLDLLRYLSKEDINRNRNRIILFIKESNLSRSELMKYIKFFPISITKKIFDERLLDSFTRE